MIPTSFLGWGQACLFIGKPVAAYFDLLSNWVLFRVGDAWYKPDYCVLDFKVVPWPSIATHVIHKVDVVVVKA